MRRQLNNTENFVGDGVARVFFRALVQLIGDYRAALDIRQGQRITFCPDVFISSRPLTSHRIFLESMLRLQCFQQFIDERLELLNSRQV